ncbi:MAG: DUF3365 domain-containing protein [Bacteroidota bacterium]|jgi:hypothetical protein
MKSLLFVLPILFILSCKTVDPNLGREDISRYRTIGSTAAAAIQSALLGEVTAAMKKGGAAYAVEFCSSKALPVTDSIARLHSCTVRRISEKNRNPLNAPENDDDRAILHLFARQQAAGGQPGDTVVFDAHSVTYYKPIVVGMQACLNCHGNSIEPATMQTIAARYPNDRATGYRLHDLRGAWKITMEKRSD